MPSPIPHSQKGLGVAGLLLRILAPRLVAHGLWWMVPIIIGVVAYNSHLPADCFPHADTVVLGTEKDFEESMKWDPKKETHAIGLWPALTRYGREKLRLINPRLADPQPVDIAPTPLRWAYIDMVVAFVVTFAWLWPYLYQPFVWVCLGAGAFGAVLPDVLLFKPIHRRLIKHDWFWRLDYIHHWVHAPVMLRKDRVAGLIFQLILTAIFAWFAWANRPPL